MAKAANTANVALMANATNQTICLTKTLSAKKTLYYPTLTQNQSNQYILLKLTKPQLSQLNTFT